LNGTQEDNSGGNEAAVVWRPVVGLVTAAASGTGSGSTVAAAWTHWLQYRRAMGLEAFRTASGLGAGEAAGWWLRLGLVVFRIRLM
jgi:hypothetical protein